MLTLLTILLFIFLSLCFSLVVYSSLPHYCYCCYCCYIVLLWLLPLLSEQNIAAVACFTLLPSALIRFVTVTIWLSGCNPMGTCARRYISRHHLHEPVNARPTLTWHLRSLFLPEGQITALVSPCSPFQCFPVHPCSRGTSEVGVLLHYHARHKMRHMRDQY